MDAVLVGESLMRAPDPERALPALRGEDERPIALVDASGRPIILQVAMKILRSPFVAALIGGGIVAAVLLIVGVGNQTKTVTVVDQTPVAAASNVAASTGSQGLTAHQIYERDAPGVVYIRSTVVQQTASPFNLFGSGTTSQSSIDSGSGIVVDKQRHDPHQLARRAGRRQGHRPVRHRQPGRRQGDRQRSRPTTSRCCASPPTACS